MPAFARLYTGDDWRSHIEDTEPSFVASLELTGAMRPRFGQPASFSRRSPAGHFQDFHIAPRRQYTITLSGEMEIGTGDGTLRRFGPGDVLLGGGP